MVGFVMEGLEDDRGWGREMREASGKFTGKSGGEALSD